MHYNSLRLGKTIWKKKKFLDRFWEFYHFIIIKMLIGNFILSFFFHLDFKRFGTQVWSKLTCCNSSSFFFAFFSDTFKSTEGGVLVSQGLHHLIKTIPQHVHMSVKKYNYTYEYFIVQNWNIFLVKKKNVPFCLAQHVKWIWKGPEKKYVYSIFCLNTDRR